MSNSSNYSDDSHSKFDEVLAEYLRRCDVGEEVDQTVFVAEHPDVADQLREYFEMADQLEQLAEPGFAETLNSDSPNRQRQPSLQVIHYFGDYELLEEIARGGMGIVYRARQKTLNRIVAVKMILAGQLATAADVKRFYAEAESAGKLDHPDIVPIYEVGQHDGQHYFSMGFVKGQNLAHHVADGPLESTEAARLVERVARAVQYAHEQGVIHRDLKPSNILIDLDGEPHITDFGLAKRVESDSDLTRTGQILGTPGFMPPEQAAGEVDVIGPEADVYSLGANLYSLLTGRPPFQSASVVDTLKQVVEREPISPRQLNPAISRDLETICLKCLEKSVARRYSTAAELADELRRILNGEPIHARPISRATRCWKWCRRNPSVAGMIGSLLVAALALCAMSVSYLYQGHLETANAALAQSRRDEIKAKNAIDQVLYFRRVALALSTWDDNDVLRARQLLRECPEDLRGWEWHYVNAVCHPESLIFENERSTPSGRLAFTSSGLCMADARRIESTKEWNVTIVNVETGRDVQTLNGSFKLGVKAAFSPDGTQIASSDWGVCRVWDLESGDEVLTLKDDNEKVRALSYSSDGTRIAALIEGRRNQDGDGRSPSMVSIWNAENGEAVATIRLRGSRVRDFAMSSNGQQVAEVIPSENRNGGRVGIWNVSNDKDDPGPIEFGDWPSSPEELTFGPESKLLAVAFYGGGDVELWDTEAQRPVITLSSSSKEVTDIAFSRNGKLVAAATGRTVTVWDIESGKKVRTLKGHISRIRSVTFSPNGDRIAAYAGKNAIRVWNVNDSAGWPKPVASPLRSTFGSDGKMEASVRRYGDRRANIEFRDSSSGTILHTLGDQKFSSNMYLAFSPDGTSLASCHNGGAVRTWDTDTGQETRFFENPSRPGMGSVAFSPDGAQVAGISQSGTIRIWDVARDEVVHTFEQAFRGGGSDLAFSSDGKMLAGCGTSWIVFDDPNERPIRIWDTQSGQELPREHYRLAWSNSVLYWSNSVRSVAFTPDGTQLASSDGAIRDVESGRVVHELGRGRLRLSPIAFLRDGSRMFTIQWKNGAALRIWDVASGAEIMTIVDLTPLGPELNRIFSDYWNGHVNVWGRLQVPPD